MIRAQQHSRAAAYLTDGCHRPATKREAIALAGMYPLPRDGESIVVAVNYLTANRLHLRNIGSAFYLDGTVPLAFWASTFGVRGVA